MPLLYACSRKRWRTWWVACLFVAVAWPATGPLPWLAFEAGHHVAANALDERDEGTLGEAAADAELAAAEIPGSPTHPLDHQCAQCEILKHLARCALPDAREPRVAAAPGEPVLPSIAVESRRAGFIATRPPIRGPPSLSV